jgi:hypothetical protein
MHAMRYDFQTESGLNWHIEHIHHQPKLHVSTAYTNIAAFLAWAQLVLVGVKSMANIRPITLIIAQTKKAT